MASITYEFYDATTGFRATCTIEEVGDGTLLFTIDVDESTGTLGDLRGLFFDLNNDDPAFLETLDATGDDVTGELFQQDNVTNLGSGANVNGEVVNETGRFDAGVEIGSSGLKGGADDIQFTQFTLSSSEYYLTLDMVTSVDTALRATSVGDADGSRNGSLKLVGDMSSGVISGAYFLDQDGNDIDNAGDTAIAGKWVTLYQADGTTPAVDAVGNPVLAVQTDVDGTYYFSNIAAGDYVVMFEDSTAEGLQFVAQNAPGADEAVDSDVDPATGRTGLVTVVAGYETTDVDAGVKAPPAPPPPPSSISGRYFDDANRNDIDDAEAGVAGKTVTLLDADGNAVATTITAADGSYFFAGLEAGSYTVRFEATDGRIFSDRDVGGDDSVDSDVEPATGQTGTIVVEAGADVTDVDVGVKDLPASISGRYFDDANGNGVDDGEAGVAGKTVTLLDAGGGVVATDLTDATGAYGFDGLAAGSYAVEFAPTEGKSFTVRDAGTDDGVDSDVDPASGRTAAIAVAAGEDVADVDAGVVAETAASWDLTGTIRTDAHSLTFIMDASFPTYDVFFGIPPVDVNLDGINNVIDAMLAAVIDRAQDLAPDQRIDLVLAGTDGVLGQQTVYARDLHGLDPHDFADEVALQAIFQPVFDQPAGLQNDVDFASALTAAGSAIQAGYGATGALTDEVVLLTTSDGIDNGTLLPAHAGYGEAAQALVTSLGASVDVMLIESLSSDWSVLGAIDSDGAVDVYSTMFDDPFNPAPDPYMLETLVSDSPAVTEGDVLGLLIGDQRFAFTDMSDGDGRIEVALSGLEGDPMTGVGIEIDTDDDGVADTVLEAALEFVDGAWNFEVGPADLLV